MSTLIPTKFGIYTSSDYVVKADYVFPYIYMHLFRQAFRSLLYALSHL